MGPITTTTTNNLNSLSLLKQINPLSQDCGGRCSLGAHYAGIKTKD